MTCARGHKAGGTDRTQASDEAASWWKGDRLAVVDDCGGIGPPAGGVFYGRDVARGGQPMRLRYARITVVLRARSRAASGTRGSGASGLRSGARRSSRHGASCGACGPQLPPLPNACQARARFLPCRVRLARPRGNGISSRLRAANAVLAAAMKYAGPGISEFPRRCPGRQASVSKSSLTFVALSAAQEASIRTAGPPPPKGRADMIMTGRACREWPGPAMPAWRPCAGGQGTSRARPAPRIRPRWPIRAAMPSEFRPPSRSWGQ
jgi:hypothetical protein